MWAAIKAGGALVKGWLFSGGMGMLIAGAGAIAVTMILLGAKRAGRDAERVDALTEVMNDVKAAKRARARTGRDLRDPDVRKFLRDKWTRD